MVHMIGVFVFSIHSVTRFSTLNIKHCSTDVYPNINSLALLFMVVTQWSMNGIAYLSPLIQERQVFYRERSAGAYRVGPYYWQRVFVELPFTIISSIIFTLIVWFGCGYATFLVPVHDGLGHPLVVIADKRDYARGSHALIAKRFHTCSLCFKYPPFSYPTDAGKYFMFLFIVFLCGETASAFAHCLSAVSPTIEVATAIAPMFLIVMVCVTN